MMGRPGRRHKQPLNDLKKTKGYCKLKEIALDRTLALENAMNLEIENEIYSQNTKFSLQLANGQYWWKENP
jgi:hypothetical protein